MSAPYHLIEEKAEDAFAAIINTLKETTDLDGVLVIKGFETTKLVEPALLIEAADSAPDYSDLEAMTGNWNVNVKFIIRTNSSEANARAVHSARVGQVRDILFRDDMVEELNKAGIEDFTAQIWTPGACHRTVEEHSIVTTQEGVLNCFPS